MTDDQPSTPPAPLVPPPPTGEPSTGSNEAKPTDNPIAVAGLVVSLLGVVLSIIVIGGFVGFVGFILSSIGLRRSKTTGHGRGAAIGGLTLALLSLAFSVGALAVIIASVNGGEEIVRDGIITTSRNVEFPPQDDIAVVECESSAGGGLALAIVTLENKSTGRSLYSVTIEWETDSGETVEGNVRSEFLPAGERVMLRLFDQTGTGIADTCRATRIERSGVGILPN